MRPDYQEQIEDSFPNNGMRTIWIGSKMAEARTKGCKYGRISREDNTIVLRAWRDKPDEPLLVPPMGP